MSEENRFLINSVLGFWFGVRFQFHAFQYCLIAARAVPQCTIHTANGRRACTRFLHNLMEYILLPQQSCNMQPLGQRTQFLIGADIF